MNRNNSNARPLGFRMSGTPAQIRAMLGEWIGRCGGDMPLAQALSRQTLSPHTPSLHTPSLHTRSLHTA